MTQPGESECLKGAVHAASASLALAASLYNVIAYSERSEKRLAAQSLFYGLLWAFEMWQAHGHWSRHSE